MATVGCVLLTVLAAPANASSSVTYEWFYPNRAAEGSGYDGVGMPCYNPYDPDSVVVIGSRYCYVGVHPYVSGDLLVDVRSEGPVMLQSKDMLHGAGHFIIPHELRRDTPKMSVSAVFDLLFAGAQRSGSETQSDALNIEAFLFVLGPNAERWSDRDEILRLPMNGRLDDDGRTITLSLDDVRQEEPSPDKLLRAGIYQVGVGISVTADDSDMVTEADEFSAYAHVRLLGVTVR